MSAYKIILSALLTKDDPDKYAAGRDSALKSAGAATTAALQLGDRWRIWNALTHEWTAGVTLQPSQSYAEDENGKRLLDRMQETLEKIGKTEDYPGDKEHRDALWDKLRLTVLLDEARQASVQRENTLNSDAIGEGSTRADESARMPDAESEYSVVPFGGDLEAIRQASRDACTGDESGYVNPVNIHTEYTHEWICTNMLSPKEDFWQSRQAKAHHKKVSTAWSTFNKSIAAIDPDGPENADELNAGKAAFREMLRSTLRIENAHKKWHEGVRDPDKVWGTSVVPTGTSSSIGQDTAASM